MNWVIKSTIQKLEVLEQIRHVFVNDEWKIQAIRYLYIIVKEVVLFLCFSLLYPCIHTSISLSHRNTMCHTRLLIMVLLKWTYWLGKINKSFLLLSPAFFPLNFLTMYNPSLQTPPPTHTHTLSLREFIHKSSQWTHSEAKAKSRYSISVSDSDRAWKLLKQSGASRNTLLRLSFGSYIGYWKQNKTLQKSCAYI